MCCFIDFWRQFRCYIVTDMRAHVLATQPCVLSAELDIQHAVLPPSLGGAGRLRTCYFFSFRTIQTKEDHRSTGAGHRHFRDAFPLAEPRYAWLGAGGGERPAG